MAILALTSKPFAHLPRLSTQTRGFASPCSSFFSQHSLHTPYHYHMRSASGNFHHRSLIVRAKPGFYSILRVSKTASKSEIKSAYRKLARSYHPDVNKEPGAEQKFKDINYAYEVLSDDEKRYKYDRHGEARLKCCMGATKGGDDGMGATKDGGDGMGATRGGSFSKDTKIQLIHLTLLLLTYMYMFFLNLSYLVL